MKREKVEISQVDVTAFQGRAVLLGHEEWIKERKKNGRKREG
jgi:hypothetical protein